MKLVFTPATLDDLDVVSEYEKASYHPDEAASKEQLRRRIIYASESGPELFTVARSADEDMKITGFVCTTLSSDDLVTDESMSVHDPSGKTVCLHSVCVSPDYRNQGIATRLLTQWIEQLKEVNTKSETKKYERIAMISRPSLTALYERVGFKKLGVSPVVHGPEPWIDCVLDL